MIPIEFDTHDVPRTPPPRRPNPVTPIPNNQAELFQGFDNALANVEPFQYTRVHDFSLPQTPVRGSFFFIQFLNYLNIIVTMTKNSKSYVML